MTDVVLESAIPNTDERSPENVVVAPSFRRIHLPACILQRPPLA
jgi:hypothetical protein